VSILVLATSRFMQEQLAALRSLAPRERFDTDPDAARADEVEAIVAFRFATGVAPRFPNLRLVASPGAGADELLAAGDIPAHVPIVRAVDPLQGRRMAQYVALMVLRQQRDLPRLEAQHQRGEWRRFAPGQEGIVGLLGYGTIGAPVADALQRLGFPVIAWARTPHREAGIEIATGVATLRSFLARCNVLVCTLPLTAETRGLLDAEALAVLPRGAYLINVSRGGVLREIDLLAALDAGQLRGAALDVFSAEPLPADNPLWRRPEILCTPHVAAVPRSDEVARQILDNLRRARDGQALLNVIDRQRGY
jgi:D-3-phosphoglycerate dehydrogenase/glyoxylate/hydroxypyruvate reductase A